MIRDLKPYPIYKDSGVPWLGEVPEHWELRRLKTRVINIDELTNEPRNTDLSIALEHVEGWTGRLLKTTAEAVFESQVKRFRSNDVLFGRLRPYLAKVTRPMRDGVCVGEFFVLRPRCFDLHAAYLEYLLRSKPIIDAISSSTFGAKMPRADWQFVGSMRLTFPSVPEQFAIARFLDHVDRRIRRYIRAKQRLIALLNEQKQAIIQRAVTRGLDPNVRLKPSGVEWLGEIPEHWEILPAFAAYKPKLIKNTGMVEKTVLSLSYGRIIIKPQEKLHGLVPESFETYQVVAPGDIILRTTDLQNDQTSLRVGYSKYRGIITAAYMCLETKGQLLNEFGYQLLNAYDLLKIFYGFGSGLRQNLDFSHIKHMPVLVPPQGEQSAIVHFLDQATTKLDRAIDAAQHEISLLREYRTRLIADVVTGKLDVREVAAGLLEEVEEPEAMDEAEALEEGEAEESTEPDDAAEGVES